MVFTDICLEELIKGLGKIYESWQDSIVGARDLNEAFYKANNVIESHHSYLYSRYPGLINIELKKTLIEAMVNAYMWGNKCSPERGIVSDWYFGEQGFVFSVSNEGEEFDFKEKIKKFYAGEKFADRHGGGFRHYAADKLHVSFEDKGRRVNIMVKNL